MSVVSFVINFFAVIGLLILISYLISYIVNYFKEQRLKDANNKVMPPPAYMQASGIRCPDYLSNTGANKETYTCSNKDFNINVSEPNTCYSDVQNKSVQFPLIPEGKTWEFGNPGGLTSMTQQEKWDFVRSNVQGNISRCDWIDKCGPANGVNAVWQGVKRWCDMTDPSQATVQ